MRKLDTSPISVAAQFRYKAGTLDHLQLATQEALNALALSIIGAAYDPTKVYILFGCVNIGALPAVNISAGAVFYNGEVYLVDAVNFFLGGGQVAIPNVQLTFYTLKPDNSSANADPVLFTDGVARNVHQIRKIAIVPGIAGSGSDAAGGLLPNFIAFVQANPQVSLSGNAVTGAFPDFVITQPANRILAVGSQMIGDVGTANNIGFIPGSNANQFNVAFAQDIGTANYKVDISIVSHGTPANDAECSCAISSKASGGFTIVISESRAVVQNISIDYTIIALP